MSRIIPLWRSAEISVHRFDHPAAHEDRPYEEVAGAFMASFVEAGSFNLEIDGTRWRVKTGDVMLHHPGMKFRAGFDGAGFNDTCLSVTYLAAQEDEFDASHSWTSNRGRVLADANRTRFLRWGIDRAIREDEPMLAEYCATEIFRPHEPTPAPLYRAQKFNWYAERIHAARARLDADYSEAHTVSDLARAVGMSMFHFTRVFTQMIGVPPHRYLAERRLAAARTMLRDGRSVTETCYACGFGHLSHFSRSFARRYGVSPSRAARRN